MLEERIEEMEAILKERAKITAEAKEVADEYPRHRIYNKIKARRGEKWQSLQQLVIWRN